MSFARLGADVPKDPMKMQLPQSWRVDRGGRITAFDYVHSYIKSPGKSFVVYVHYGNTGKDNINFLTWEQFTQMLEDDHAVSI